MVNLIGGNDVQGRVTAETLRELLDAFNQHDLDRIMEVRKGLASRFTGDRGASEWLLTGTSSTGESLKVRGCDLFEFRDAKVIRKDSYWKIVG